MTIESLKPYLGDLAHLYDQSSDDKGSYIHPKLRNLGTVSVVLVREIVAPAVFRNQEAEITDIAVDADIDGQAVRKRFVRAVPNKFKHKERANGLKLLRHFKAGGAYPQNRNAIPEKAPVSQAFDLNSLVFGDSANQGKRVLPVKAAVLYSDGLGLVPYEDAVDKTFHNRASEDGSLFDAASKQNSNNLFERHFVKPGTLMVQVVSTSGRILPLEGFDHLMLCLGLSGAYGGQTSVTGVNVRTHVAGIYASLLEQPETSPYHIAARIEGSDVDRVCAEIHGMLAPVHEVALDRAAAEAYRARLVAELTEGGQRLEAAYAKAAQDVGDLFEQWFNPRKAG
ncbi:MAG TPA: hypothetical protein VK943_10840 [Arenibaculum sp.]|nr:hypothetical protein [Arenibaculum sp.]